MSSASTERGFFRSLGLRISAWYASGFLISFVLIGVFALWVVTDYDLRVDREEITQEFDQDAARCRQVGSGQFCAETKQEAPDVETTLIRLARPDGQTALFMPAFGQSESETRWLEPRLRSQRGEGWSRVPAPKGAGGWQVYSGMMPDGHWLQVGKRDYHAQGLRGRLRGVLLPLASFVVFLALAGAAIFTARALRPVRRLINITRAVVEGGDMTARVPVRTHGGHELDELNELFNRMLARNENLIRGMREALDNVAHDLRTPLTRLRLSAEGALRAPEKGAAIQREALRDAIEESERALAMLRALMDISEAEHGAMRLSLEPLEVAAVVTSAMELYDHVAQENGVRLRMKAEPGLMVTADKIRLQQVISNLLDNAIKYSRPGGEVSVEVSRKEEKERAGIEFAVRDAGIGISAADLPKIWDRLYRADQSRSQRGSGLGLSLVKAIVQAHGGSTEVESTLGQGSVFRFTLASPAAGAAAPAARSAPAAGAPADRR